MHDLIRVSDEVQTALEEERAVVALETTLVAHGFPAPDGVETGLASEAAVRAAGAIPATIGVLDGQIRIGLDARRARAVHACARKLGPRDLAVCAVQGAVGATTVGGTLTAAAAVGIRFMGTGGLGGVHRGFPTPPDVSADLAAAARIPAVIASSGVKSLLDVPATIELLETLGVPVIGYRTDTLPLFYDADGGPPVSARADDADEIARIADAHWQLGGNTLLVGRPPAESLDVAPLIEEAVAAAERDGISGQAVTPFVLAYLHEHSDGETRRVNRDLIVDNAGLAGEIAAAYAPSRRSTVSLYDAVRDLPLSVDSYALEGLEQQVSSGFLRKSTVIRLSAPARRGSARTSPTRRPSTTSSQARGPILPLARRVDDRTFSQHLATLPLFDHEPEQHAYHDYRRWAYESAALDLALRQAGLSLGDAVGRHRAAADVRRLDAPRRAVDDRAPRAWLGYYPTCGSSSTPPPTGRTS